MCIRDSKYAVRAVVGTEPKVNRIRKGLTLVKCTIYDETGTLNVTYFNNCLLYTSRCV